MIYLTNCLFQFHYLSRGVPFSHMFELLPGEELLSPQREAIAEWKATLKLMSNE